MKILISKNAEKHLDSIFDFICEVNKKAAIDVYNTILNGIDFLIEQPEMGAIELLLEEFPCAYRSLIVMKKYKIVYFIKDEIIHVSAIWDCRRNPANLLKEFVD